MRQENAILEGVGTSDLARVVVPVKALQMQNLRQI